MQKFFLFKFSKQFIDIYFSSGYQVVAPSPSAQQIKKKGNRIYMFGTSIYMCMS